MNVGDIPASTLISWVFLAGAAWSQFRSGRASLREQGKRIGALEAAVVELRTRLATVEKGNNGHEH